MKKGFHYLGCIQILGIVSSLVIINWLEVTVIKKLTYHNWSASWWRTIKSGLNSVALIFASNLALISFFGLLKKKIFNFYLDQKCWGFFLFSIVINFIDLVLILYMEDKWYFCCFLNVNFKLIIDYLFISLLIKLYIFPS